MINIQLNHVFNKLSKILQVLFIIVCVVGIRKLVMAQNGKRRLQHGGG